MEFRLKLMKVMEKSWNFEIIAKSHGKVMEFDKRNIAYLQIAAAPRQLISVMFIL